MSYLDLVKKAERELMAGDDGTALTTHKEGKAAKASAVIKGALTQETPPEALAASILAEHTTDEATRILAFWKETFGVDLNRVRERSAEVGVQEHLRRLREWQRRFGG